MHYISTNFKTISHEINGWQRIFFVIAFWYSVAIIYITISVFPHNTYTERQWYENVFSVAKNTEYFHNIDSKEFAKIHSNLDYPGLVKLIDNIVSEQGSVKEDDIKSSKAPLVNIPTLYDVTKANLDNINNAYIAEKIFYKRKQYEFIKFSILLLFIPLGVLYSIGWSIRWIRRGFKFHTNV